MMLGRKVFASMAHVPIQKVMPLWSVRFVTSPSKCLMWNYFLVCRRLGVLLRVRRCLPGSLVQLPSFQLIHLNLWQSSFFVPDLGSLRSGKDLFDAVVLQLEQPLCFAHKFHNSSPCLGRSVWLREPDCLRWELRNLTNIFQNHQLDNENPHKNRSKWSLVLSGILMLLKFISWVECKTWAFAAARILAGATGIEYLQGRRWIAFER